MSVAALSGMLALVSVAVMAAAETMPQPAVTMRLSSDRILLGEPVWVVVAVRNGSDAVVRWNPGDYCYMLHHMPVTAVVPEAAQGSGKPQRCEYGMRAGDCMIGGNTIDIAPGKTATWRYLLEGDFHFTHAGAYDVTVTSHPGEPFRRTPDRTQTHIVPPPVSQTLTLVVLARDDAGLLTREEQMAAEVEAVIGPGKPDPAPADERAAWRQRVGDVLQLRRGLAAQPVAGMEPVFEHWLQISNSFDYDAISGLKNLNTETSRAALAKIAQTANKPNSHLQESATAALGELGDRTYYPLMVELTGSADANVRRQAIFAVGSLGGADAVPRLVAKVRDGEARDRSDAVFALGEAHSRAAVRALIDLMTTETGIDPANIEWELFVLTHHRLPQVTYLRTIDQTRAGWEQWWNTDGASAPVYSPFDCAPKQASK